MIWGTSEIWSKSGLVDLLTITKILLKIQEKLWEHPGKYYLWKCETHKFRFFRFLKGLDTICSLFSSPHFKLYFLKMRIENDDECINKIYRSLDMNFISIKKHEMVFLQLFYFQVREPTNCFIFKEGNHPILNSR